MDIHVSIRGLRLYHFWVFGCWLFFFTCFLLDFQNLGIHATMAHLKYLLPIVFDLQCLIDPCCCILICLFFHEELWKLFLALNAMGCFDMCYAISWSIWNNNTPNQQLNITFCICYFRIVFGLDVETFCIIFRSMPIRFISIVVSI